MSAPALQLDHFAFPVFDAAQTYRFYRDVMQFPLIDALSGDDWGGKPWLMMIFRAADGRQLALCALQGARAPAADGLPADVRHFAFSVKSSRDQQEWKKRLRERAVAFSEEDHGTQRSIYFQDPNGVMLEITSPESPSLNEVNADADQTVASWLSRYG